MNRITTTHLVTGQTRTDRYRRARRMLGKRLDAAHIGMRTARLIVRREHAAGRAAALQYAIRIVRSLEEQDR